MAKRRVKQGAEVVQDLVRSAFLSREVSLTIILPPGYTHRAYPVLWLNDGQDIPALNMIETIQRMFQRGSLRHIVTVGVHANEKRMEEYGTMESADFANRGAKAGLYANFFLRELVPYIRGKYNVSVSRHRNAIAGFSLGGLSALDIGWNHPDHFARIGVFSGSLWWRKRAINKGYRDDRDRIIHQVIQKGEKRKGLRFWLEAGTHDEVGDRNHNGVIDAIDDTIDLIRILKEKGYTQPDDIQFLLVKGGEHNQGTWGEVMPHFLLWAFGRPKVPA